MDIDLSVIENCILKSRDDLKNITITEKVFKKDTEDNSTEIACLTISYEKDGKQEQKSLFIKIPHNNPRELKRLNKYSKEILVYSKLFPQYKCLLPHNSLHAEFYGTNSDILILEDLSLAYKKEQSAQLTVTQFTVALRKLAKLHALSIKIQETQPEILNQLKNLPGMPPFDLFSSPERKIWTKKQLQKLVDDADGIFAEKHPQVLLYFENYLEQISEELGKVDHKLNVLNHGNIYTKNIWFAYDELEEVVDAKFTNFQYCHWGSPIVDLILFSISSLPFELFEQMGDTLLEIYTSTFNATLEKVKSNQRLRVDELQSQVNSNYEYFLYFLIGIAPDESSDSHKFGSKEYMDVESYNKACKLWMSHIMNKGVFSKYEDMAIVIYTFIDTFEAEHKTTISRYTIDRTVVKPGDNFCSLIVRLKFEHHKGGELSQNSVLLKIPSLSLNYDGLKETNVYNQEIFIYQKIFPHMYQKWKGELIAPTCYTISEAKILVLEDLSIRGYHLCDKLQQLDLEHCHVALATLATHHAISLEYLQKCDQAIHEELAQPFNVTSTVRTLSQTLYSKFLRVMEPLVDNSLHQKMQLLKEKIPKDAIYGRYMDDYGLNVVGHCDYWTNNILFRYDEGKVCSAKAIDWQLSRLASPVVDLIFFFITSVRFEIFEMHKDTLLDFYLDTFNKTLCQLGSDLVYSREELDDAFRRYKYYFWLYVGTELPFVMGKDGSFDSEANSDVASESFLSVAKKWVHYLDKENLI